MTRAAVVLAAGKGTRFRSDLAKVLHPVAGRSLLGWVLSALQPIDLDRVVVVVGHQADDVAREAARVAGDGVVTVHQAEQRGTGHALRTAFEAGALDGVHTVLVVPGDAPLVAGAPLEAMFDAQRGNAAAMMTTVLDDPTGYGRILRDRAGAVARVVEEADATPDERAVREVNVSMYVFDAAAADRQLSRLGTHNAQGEEYLTDIVELLVDDGVAAVAAPPHSVRGVNDREQLAQAGAALRSAMLSQLLRDGVTIVDPATTYVGADCTVAPDAVLLPSTHLEGATHIAERAVIGPSTRLVDTTVDADATVTFTVAVSAVVGAGAQVGPFTYLRPDAQLAERAKAGAFVEVKQSVVGPRSKVPHLSYIGNTVIGSDTNIGAATVTVNYDGRRKHQTTIGDRVRIGADTMLIAPIKVGDDAYTGAGSVVTSDVPAGALAVERTEQRTIEGYAERKRGPDTS
ncbi:MAG: bifunctional UDP-N-acetylglucosamine diphosphorylase/glucosamine-1-phosphate N-acetyltransferase GlmU [Actinobacteria bacterium]|nr:bifunctional UDP-N-acetylglucosamine diphosphorylase/glucosamine-1-phosphate N-acetyltransferase GlmU [Actinomycetota bacterium]